MWGGEVYRDICKQEGTEMESRTDAGHKDDAWIGVGRGHLRPRPPVMGCEAGWTGRLHRWFRRFQPLQRVVHS